MGNFVCLVGCLSFRAVLRVTYTNKHDNTRSNQKDHATNRIRRSFVDSYCQSLVSSRVISEVNSLDQLRQSPRWLEAHFETLNGNGQQQLGRMNLSNALQGSNSELTRLDAFACFTLPPDPIAEWGHEQWSCHNVLSWAIMNCRCPCSPC